ncbi:MAG: transporter, family, multidrug resistance protein [Candidatus Eremiobacteraeota bacterium]|jgi:DHA1 family bicyclomycin/chloramphenicol resistance-like MFS transporter|nr:transporter, family, multidrug resistance protein [Candidatus Eremiobacteraeota bacterium]
MLRSAHRAPDNLAGSAGFVMLLGALTMLPPLSIDVSLPGLPVIAHAIGASSASMQQSLSVFIFAFGAGQLVLGPLSDRYGRRPVLLAGLVVFSLAGVACTFANGPALLLVARFVQGLGACAGTMSARAIVQDVAPTRERAASLQAYVSAVTTVAPIVAPLLGALVLVTLGWRWLYGVLVVVGIALLVAVLTRLPETAPGTAGRRRDAYVRVLRLPRTIPLALFVACAFGAYFALISGSPFALVAQMHVASAPYAVAFAINACALLAGSFTAGRLSGRVGAERLFGTGVMLATTAAAVACAVDVLAPTPAGFTATFALFAFAFGIANPNAYAAALADAGPDAGTTSAVLGATQMIGGAIASALATALPVPPSEGIGVTVLGASLLAALAYVWSRGGRQTR